VHQATVLREHQHAELGNLNRMPDRMATHVNLLLPDGAGDRETARGRYGILNVGKGPSNVCCDSASATTKPAANTSTPA
jgi:hypothetical protein